MSLSNKKLRHLLGHGLGGVAQQLSNLHNQASEGLTAEMLRL
jgi:hypothetical protein